MVLFDPDGVPYNVVDCYLTTVLFDRLYFFNLVELKLEK
jgi:hypothetical protein